MCHTANFKKMAPSSLVSFTKMKCIGSIPIEDINRLGSEEERLAHNQEVD